MKNTLFAAILISLLYGLISFIGWNHMYALNQSVTIDWSMLAHVSIGTQLLIFLIAHLLIIFFALILSYLPAQALCQRHQRYIPYVTLFLFVLLTYALIGYSTQYYPWLEIALISDSLNPDSPYLFIGKIAALALALSCTYALWTFIRQRSKRVFLLGLASAFFCVPLLQQHLELPDNPTNTAHSDLWLTDQEHSNKHPNVIIVGLDSISFYQAQKYQHQLPFLQTLLKTGNTFSNAFTPQGRTFVAWNSILTGQYPTTSGITFNLAEFKDKVIQNTLVSDVKALGYTTVFAQDERRFSNINEEYGFDHTIGPTVGAIDFILPLFSDHLFSAYFTNSSIGAWLFPSFYTNRVSSVTYSPEHFVQSIVNKISAIPEKKPLFFAAHFCLAHYPYKWRSYRPSHNHHNTDEVSLYSDALQQLDKQLSALFMGLKQQGRLHNAIIILLSDHGEGLGAEPPLWITHDADVVRDFGLIQRGHGNSLLSRDQNNVILNIRDTRTSTPALQFDQPVSLVDVRPTILTLLKQPSERLSALNIDGIPLPPAVSTINQRYLFMETGIPMNLPKPNADAQDLASAVQEQMLGFQVNPKGRLIMKDEFLAQNVDKKQYGAVFTRYMLLTNPNKDDDLLLINLESGDWQRRNSSHFEHDEHRHLLEKMQCYQQANRDCYQN